LYAMLIGASLIFISPVLFTLSNALKSDEQMYRYPIEWIPNPVDISATIAAVTYLPFGRYAINTFVIAIGNTLGHILCGSLVAFGFSRLRGPGRDALFSLLVATMMLPAQVTIIPTYILMTRLGWMDTFLPLIVPAYVGAAGGSAFFIFLLRQFMLGINTELDDAARIDGCGTLRLWWEIIMPLMKPAVAAVAVFGFVGNYNDFFGPLLYLNDRKKLTLALGLRFVQTNMLGGAAREAAPSVQGLFGLALLVLLPIVIVFFAAQKYFIQGVTFTGFKG
jgi:multiple sugar transport system permease protein